MEHILTIWPVLKDLATDLGKPYPTVAAWKARGSIPGEYDLEIIEAAKKRGKKLTLQQLAEYRASRGATQ